MNKYTVRKVAELAGITVRTLHVYHKKGLLEPAEITEKGYRLYGEKELHKLQQILFYKELDFSLKEIKDILSNPDYDAVDALSVQKATLKKRMTKLNTLIKTIDKTILNIKKGRKMKAEELYEGFPKEKAEEYRKEAYENWGNKVKQSEEHLMKMNKKDFNKLKDDFSKCWSKLASMTNEKPDSEKVQQEIEKHYHSIRMFWGTSNLKDNQAKEYLGLAELYESDPRFTEIEGKQIPGFADFLKKAIEIFVEKNLK